MHVAWVLNINYVHRHLKSASNRTNLRGLLEEPYILLKKQLVTNPPPTYRPSTTVS